MSQEREALLATLDGLLHVQAAADRLLVRLRARGALRTVERSGVFPAAEVGHPVAEIDQHHGCDEP